MFEDYKFLIMQLLLHVINSYYKYNDIKFVVISLNHFFLKIIYNQLLMTRRTDLERVHNFRIQVPYLT